MIKNYIKKPVKIQAIRYDGTNAAEIEKFITDSLLGVNVDRNGNETSISIETLEGDMTAQIGDYIIKGVKGEFYPCKPDIFKLTYDYETEPSGDAPEPRDFSYALKALKRGLRVARKGWNGKGMYLWLKPEAKVRAEICNDPNLKNIAKTNGGEILALGTICMYTHDSTGRKAILTGWLASQSDMLSTDWYIIHALEIIAIY